MFITLAFVITEAIYITCIFMHSFMVLYPLPEASLLEKLLGVSLYLSIFNLDTTFLYHQDISQWSVCIVSLINPCDTNSCTLCIIQIFFLDTYNLFTSYLCPWPLLGYLKLNYSNIFLSEGKSHVLLGHRDACNTIYASTCQELSGICFLCMRSLEGRGICLLVVNVCACLSAC